MAPAPPLYLARSAAIFGFADVLVRLGHDPHKLVRMAGLPYACLNEAELRVPSQGLLRLLELAAEQSGVTDLGLRIAAQRPAEASSVGQEHPSHRRSAA